MTTFIRNPILATIAYYDILDYPLTLIEVFKYLINPARFSSTEAREIGLNDIIQELGHLVKVGIIDEKNGFYFLSGRDKLYDLRIARQKTAAQKWKKFLFWSKWLVVTPYLRGIFASGSMALENTAEESDFDVLVIVQSGRLYTCRLFLWLITSLLGIRRKRFQKKAPNKFCFNHYVTDSSLSINHRSLYNAQTYTHLKPIFVSDDLFDKFYKANTWLNGYFDNFQPQKYFIRRSINPNVIVLGVSRVVEFVVNVSLGSWFENLLRYYQQGRIRKNPLTNSPGGRVVFNDRELEFHPHSFEKFVIEEYNKKVKKLGIVLFRSEEDSGLSK